MISRGCLMCVSAGDLGAAIRDLMQRFAKEHRLRTDVKTIDDMRTFMDRYPAFRSQSSRVSKHVTLTAELSKLVEVCALNYFFILLRLL
jgi:vacuolar protein sorting-associated protein 45